MIGSIALVGSVGPQVPEIAKCMTCLLLMIDIHIQLIAETLARAQRQRSGLPTRECWLHLVLYEPAIPYAKR